MIEDLGRAATNGVIMKTKTLSLTLLAITVAACERPPERAACAPSTLASIEAAYVAEALALCKGQTFDTCEALPALERKYAAQREEWITCK